MRERDWAPAREPEGELVDKPRLAARATLARLGRTLISGDLESAVAALAAGAPMLGLYAPAPAGAHALRIARDRALLVTPAPLGAADGWCAGFGATPVDDGWATVEVTGPDAALVLRQGTSVDLEAGSPSAAVLFAGLRCLLVRSETGFRLHVEAPWLEALVAWLDGA